MKYKFEVSKIIEKVNEYTIEVETEEEAEELLSKIGDDINTSSHPDDIFEIIRKAGYEVVEYSKDFENYQYELL